MLLHRNLLCAGLSLGILAPNFDSQSALGSIRILRAAADVGGCTRHNSVAHCAAALLQRWWCQRSSSRARLSRIQILHSGFCVDGIALDDPVRIIGRSSAVTSCSFASISLVAGTSRVGETFERIGSSAPARPD
jgi:hypothetical protein